MGKQLFTHAWFTHNYGGRFDQSYEYLNEYQFSPRVNAVYQLDSSTKVHGGYARYFTPAPLELEQGGNPAIYSGTTAALSTLTNDPVKVKIIQSSGYRMLDQAALKAVRLWKFQPGSMGGITIDSTVTVPHQISIRKMKSKDFFASLGMTNML